MTTDFKKVFDRNNLYDLKGRVCIVTGSLM